MSRALRLSSLRTKLIVTLVPLAVVVVGAMTLIAVTKMTSAEKTTSYAQMSALASSQARGFDADLEQNVAVSRSMAAMMEAYRGASAEETSAMVKRVAERYPRLAGVYVGYEPNAFDGRDAAHSGRPYQIKAGGFGPYWNRLGGKLALEPLVDTYTSDYYLKAKEAKRDVVVEPYLYQGVLMASYVAPIIRDGRFLGIAGNDATLTELDRGVRQIKVLDSGYAFLVSNAGMFVSAPEKGLSGKQTLAKLGEQEGNPQLVALAKAVQQGRSGQFETTDPWTGKQVVLSYAPVRAGHWSLVTVAPTGEVLAAANTLRWQLLVAGLVGILLITGAIALVAARLTKPLKAFVARLRALNDTSVAGLKEGIGALADGDLTVEARSDVEPLPVRGHDEIADASHTANALIEQTGASVDAYNEARRSLGSLIGQVSVSASTVSASSQQMASTSSEAGRAVSEIANAVGDVAAGAERQVRMVDAARVAADQTSEAAEQARLLADEGASASEKATAAMTEVRDSSIQVTEAIRSLAAKSDEIGGIVSTITAIADQTNLLALNAAIEAARAGDQGRGFAVVAEEVRKLAEESQQAAGTISGLIDEIQADTSATVTVVEEGAARSADGAQVVEEARLAFTRIGAAVRDVSTRIGEIATATSEVAAVAEQSSASTEQVSASTQETSASTQEIAATAQELARTAEELERLVGQFQLAE
ncbi:MAG: methyl-accepting chemotaxis sensory transducer with Cache sensor [Solirubrobacterales bacterium]|jgi:methyl-accepting chemotaxis protein|nr:methyl-accepting chemotaxis sensory transducer with Cache sensor [Solirubrobacterales bacterium]